jgi:hypothetical protein
MNSPLQPIHDAKIAIEAWQKQRQTLHIEHRAAVAAEVVADELTFDARRDDCHAVAAGDHRSAEGQPIAFVRRPIGASARGARAAGPLTIRQAAC